MSIHTRSRKAKESGAAKTSFALNPEFGYLNSQVLDKDAFTRYFGAPAGEETQLELQELSSGTEVLREGARSAPRDEIKPTIVKIEKENLSSSRKIDVFPKILATSQPNSLKRQRREVEPKMEDLHPGLPQMSEHDILRARISHLEHEVACLRHEIDTKATTERVIRDLQLEWQHMRADCLAFQTRVGGLGVRMHRAENHIDEIAQYLPQHHGWKSEIGSDFDPDCTLAEVEDGSQPVMWEWSQEGSQEDEWDSSVVEERKEIDV
ncbi:hypothetical protein B0H14DRAFT_3482123 [Mycena olivaceomarginata]|nr:hypothetical protein B0H14DRAFT_3482123 [Mycena olivaceomarginata]